MFWGALVVLIHGATRAVKLKEPELCILNILYYSILFGVFNFVCSEDSSLA